MVMAGIESIVMNKRHRKNIDIVRDGRGSWNFILVELDSVLSEFASFLGRQEHNFLGRQEHGKFTSI